MIEDRRYLCDDGSVISDENFKFKKVIISTNRNGGWHDDVPQNALVFVALIDKTDLWKGKPYFTGNTN